MNLSGRLRRRLCVRTLRTCIRFICQKIRAGRSALEKINKLDDLGSLADLIAMHVTMGYEKRQEILECLDEERRYEIVSAVLMEDVDLFRIREAYRRKVKEEVDKNQKEYFLREQMKVIRQELGDGISGDDYVEKYRDKLAKLKCSDEVQEG